MPLTIYMAADHGGFDLKNKLVDFLQGNGYKAIDLGSHQLNPTDDYPDFAFSLAQKIKANKNSLGILICRNGIGISIAANKVKGIRAGLCVFPDQAVTAKTDDNCNILVLPADFVDFQQAQKIVGNFLKTDFSQAPRHYRRLQKITQFEDKNYQSSRSKLWLK